MAMINLELKNTLCSYDEKVACEKILDKMGLTGYQVKQLLYVYAQVDNHSIHSFIFWRYLWASIVNATLGKKILKYNCCMVKGAKFSLIK